GPTPPSGPAPSSPTSRLRGPACRSSPGCGRRALVSPALRCPSTQLERDVRVLVTGGAGFIGSTLVDRLLAEGCDVDVIDDLSTGSLANLASARTERTRKLSFHRLDVRSPQLADVVAHRRPEVIFHLAAQLDVRVSVARPMFDAEVNILGSLNVLEAALA